MFTLYLLVFFLFINVMLPCCDGESSCTIVLVTWINSKIWTADHNRAEKFNIKYKSHANKHVMPNG